jgi:hypothetical protein
MSTDPTPAERWDMALNAVTKAPRPPLSPRTWELPPEPGPEVTAIRCECHGRWERLYDGSEAWYLRLPSSTHLGPYRVFWCNLYGDHVSDGKTISDATEELSP